MNTKEVILQTVALILFACFATWVELQIIGAPPEIVFLREAKLYSHMPAHGIQALEDDELAGHGSKTATLPTVDNYCADNKCDISDLLVVIYISAETTKELFESGEAQFIDARNREIFLDGHIPYAINMPVSSFSAGWPDEIQLLMKELKAVVYCDGISCDASQLVAKHLVRYGFDRVLIVEPGFPGWEETDGCPVEQGEGNA
ncbi:MAG: rhodanese-like domain-containing protein [Deltaproteobacteria bacterium]|nr:rhodanese-like domain-containing protein [Deltaproteobacteria bacterium]